ncbi:MAG: hypothetical protein EAZ27_14370 [Cytophagales bacterium]|nr:MAG: hypothetical protein EAZ27_14370 [Cytophagales bacterium]
MSEIIFFISSVRQKLFIFLKFLEKYKSQKKLLNFSRLYTIFGLPNIYHYAIYFKIHIQTTFYLSYFIFSIKKCFLNGGFRYQNQSLLQKNEFKSAFCLFYVWCLETRKGSLREIYKNISLFLVIYLGIGVLGK